MTFRKDLLALPVLLAMCAVPARAELLGSPVGTPVFTASEKVIIKRNVALREILDEDPWLVRRVLDALANAELQSSVAGRSAVNTSRSSPEQRPSDTFDKHGNPDLDKAQRASPEAVHDLFQLIKQAGSSKPKVVPR